MTEVAKDPIEPTEDHNYLNCGITIQSSPGKCPFPEKTRSRIAHRLFYYPSGRVGRRRVVRLSMKRAILIARWQATKGTDWSMHVPYSTEYKHKGHKIWTIIRAAEFAVLLHDLCLPESGRTHPDVYDQSRLERLPRGSSPGLRC